MRFSIFLILLSKSRLIFSFSHSPSLKIQNSLKAVTSRNDDTEQQLTLETLNVSDIKDRMEVASKKMAEKASKSLNLKNEVCFQIGSIVLSFFYQT